ncbi:MAG: glycosyl hydrolase 115 family protein [Defluviitaleaceae bacterium]|nr:glycosyl hydrolase 115 family protein [Defluviitaleaceae bacterium]MCL2273343.1 glycosyl hydrolase 115 family protein [Defluviitaleaceae bacterium]
MGMFELFANGKPATIVHEASALKGVKRIANTLAQDISLVVGNAPQVTEDISQCAGSVICVATAGHSAFAAPYVSQLEGKRECYLIKLIPNPFPQNPKITQALFIIGSDKRGTMYGMFRVSEMCGVSPLVFWGDAAPVKKDALVLTFDGDIISKQPSVKYRGFFINDEWPAFGNWATKRYGDVNAKAYDKIFELVIRLKGNYFWPAMWNSSFSQDGPGLANAELADEYGVIMGASHHEPMCRAGVEWQRQYKNYGDDNTWSFITNADAITQFWKDGIIRNKPFENVITIGMRGESDSNLMGANATMQDNVNVLKNAISVQHKLISENINANLKEVPRMFAIYKEVEDFFFGGDGFDGLRNWDAIEDVILLLSDDNHGNVRALPQLMDKPHAGGYGMYYHFDYHGGPVSYEWINSTNLTKAWEQLTFAYEHGVQEMWIVNVGDLKGNEYPLSFFMDLAYDYEKWGITNLDSATTYTKQWLDAQFNGASDAQKTDIHTILDMQTRWNAARIPESIHPDVYKNNFHEINSTSQILLTMLEKTEHLRTALPAHCLPAYESMVYYPVTASVNSLLVNLVAGMNHVHAKRGAIIANGFAQMLENHIALDKSIVEEFHQILDGKWNYMMASAHMGFRSWDDSNWTYPVVNTVVPISQPKIIVSFRGNDTYTLGMSWGARGGLKNDELTRPDISQVLIDIDSRSDMDFKFKLACEAPWLSFSQKEGASDLQAQPRITIIATCDRALLSGEQTANITLDFAFKNGETKRALLEITAGNANAAHKGAFLWAQNYVCIAADAFTQKTDVNGEGWRIVPRLGRSGNAVKSFPANKSWENEGNKPAVTYAFTIPAAGEYAVTFYLSPRNPRVKGGTINSAYRINQGECIAFNTLPDDYHTEHHQEWSSGVLNNIRKATVTAHFEDGVNHLHLLAGDPNVLPEHIVIYPANAPPAPTHLAPPESYRLT